MWIKRLGRWRAAVLAALAVVGVVLAASSMIVRIYGPSFTRQRVETVLAEALGQPARVRAVQLSLWRGRLRVVDLDVPRTPDGLLLRAAAVDVSIDIRSLWRRELTVSALATDLQFEMTTSETQTDGPGIFPLPDHVQIGPLRIGIGSARVTGSHIVIRHPQSVRTVEVGGADVTAWPVGGDLDVSGRIDMLRADAFGRREQVDQVVVDGRLSADLIRIRRLGWRWAGWIRRQQKTS